MSDWSVAKMAELGARHADLEARGLLEPLLETLVEDPLYEFHPIGRCMRGGAMVRRFYEQFIANFLPLRGEVQLLGEWVNESAVVQEYALSLTVDGTPESHHVVGILIAEGDRLKGERVYASERFIRLMTGDLFEELLPL